MRKMLYFYYLKISLKRFLKKGKHESPTTHISSIPLNLVCELQAFIFRFKLDFPAGTLPIFPYRSKGPSSTINSDWAAQDASLNSGQSNYTLSIQHRHPSPPGPTHTHSPLVFLVSLFTHMAFLIASRLCPKCNRVR